MRKSEAKSEFRKLIKRETKAGVSGSLRPEPQRSPKGKRAAITAEDARAKLKAVIDELEEQMRSPDADVRRRAAVSMGVVLKRNVEGQTESDPDEHQEYIAVMAREGVRDHWASTVAAVSGCLLPSGELVDGVLPRPTVEEAEAVIRYCQAVVSGYGESVKVEDVTGRGAAATDQSAGADPVAVAPVITPPEPDPPKDRGDEPCKCGEPRRRHEGWALACADCGCPLFTLRVIE